MIDSEDYKEPRCLDSKDFYEPSKETHEHVPIQRILGRLDRFFVAGDLEGAEKHLTYWIDEAKGSNDREGMLTLLNESTGLYRRLNEKEKAFKAAEEAMDLLSSLGMEGSETGGTTYLNTATVHQAFGDYAGALELYKKALEILSMNLRADSPKMAGLYNNMAESYVSNRKFEEAKEMYKQAILIMENESPRPPEEAIVYINLADASESEKGIEKAEPDIEIYLDKAEEVLDDDSLEHDSRFADVCDKCASTFDYYGRFATANKLKEIIGEINERLRNS